MGVTKQAAQKRFVLKGTGGASDLDPTEGFSRFTDRARKVVMAAQTEARASGNGEISPEHLVLGLLIEPDALAATSIVAQGVSLQRVRQIITKTLPPASESVPDLIPFDARARRALDLTFREALRLGHNYTGAAHILLALLELENGTGVFAGLGVDKATTEADILATLAARHQT